MFNSTDEVISKVLFTTTSDNYEFPHDIVLSRLKKLNNQHIKTLSGKVVFLRVFSDSYCNIRVETGTLTIRVAQCAFEKFCDCFPFNNQLCYKDLQNLLHHENKFSYGVMSPVGLYGSQDNHIKNSNVIEQLDLFYGIILGGYFNTELQGKLKNSFNFLLDSHSTPIILQCSTDEEWQVLLSQYNPVIIDVTKIKNKELFGTDWSARKQANSVGTNATNFWEEYHKSIYFEPDWLKELKMRERKILVLTNFDKIPYKDINPNDLSEDEYCPFERNDEVVFGQLSYLFLMRNSAEPDEDRELNTNSPYKFPLDATTIIIQNPNSKYQIAEPIMSRAFILRLEV